MSLEKKEVIKCPKCNKESDFTIWNSINVSLDEEVKEKVLNGDIFNFKCLNCRHESNVVYSTLYHDMDNKYMIYLLVNDETEEEVNDNCALDYVEPGEYKLRIVRDQNKLIERIRIFEDGLDDCIVEALKSIVARNLPEDKINSVSGLFYNGKSSDGIDYIAFIENESMSCTVPMDAYNTIFSDNKFSIPNKFCEITEFTYYKYLPKD